MRQSIMRAAMDTLESRRLLASISGFVYNDVNGDGARQEEGTDATFAGISAYIDTNKNGKLDTGEPSRYTLTNGGKFTFGDLAAGTYTVRLQFPDSMYRQTDPAPGSGKTVTVGVDGAATMELGLQRVYRVGGFVYNDANRDGVRQTDESALLSGQTVYLDTNNNAQRDDGEKTFTTQVDGFYFYVPAGTYNVRLLTKTGWAQSQPTENAGYVVTVPSEQNPPRYFGTYEIPKGVVTGLVWNDADGDTVRDDGEPGVVEARVWSDLDRDGILDDGEPSALTNSTGAYELKLAPGEHLIRQQLLGLWSQTTPLANAGQSVLVVSGQTIANKNFGRRSTAPGTVGGVVWNDVNGNGVRDAGEPGLANQTVYIDFNNNGVLDPIPSSDTVIKTNADGAWSIPLTGGVLYRIRAITPEGTTRTKPTSGVYEITPVAGKTVDGVNFGYKKNETPPATDRVTLQAEKAVLTNGTTVSKANAGFTGDGYADFGGIESGAEFTITRGSAGTSDLFIRYANGSDGKRPLKVLVNGVLVGTFECGPTGGWTKWAETKLPAVQLPAGTVKIKLVASTAAGGANVDWLNVAGSAVVTPPPTTNTASISGVLWTETDGDGIRETGETRLSGKIVFIDANRNGVIDAGERTATTNVEGGYSFTGLAAGTYRVARLRPDGYWFSSPKTGYWEITLTAGQKRTGVDIGTTNKAPT